MDPDTMKIAMEQMAKMSPEQLAAMQRQMQDIPQSVIEEQMKLFNNLTPEQRRMAQEQARRTDPASLLAQAGPLAGNMGWKLLKEAEELKAAGNAEHRSGQYAGAAQKYEEASQKVQGQPTAEAKALQTACKLNLSSCYLNLGQHQRCVDICTDVIRMDSHNVKARYRRGQAYMAQQKLQAAVEDLSLAVKVAPADQKSAIQTKLQQAQEALNIRQASDTVSPMAPQSSTEVPRTRDNASDDVVAPSTAAASAPDLVEEPAQEEVIENLPASNLQARGQGGAASQGDNQYGAHWGSAPLTGMAGVQGPGAAQHLRQMADMMRQNPALLQAMQSMSPEQLADMARISGVSHDQLDPEMTNMAMKQFSDMSPEQLEQIAHMAEGMPGTGPSSAPPMAVRASQRSQPADPGSNPFQQDQAQAAAQMMQNNPAMMSQAMEMMKNMPEAMASMAQSVQGLGGAQGPRGQAEQMEAMMKNPETLKAMQNMLAMIKPEDLAAMSRQAGMNLSEEQATKMKEQMKSLTPEQMAMAMKASQVLQKGLQAAQKARNAIFSQKALVIALCVALLAFLLKYFHYF